VLPHRAARIAIPRHGVTVASTPLAPQQFSSVSVILFVSVVLAVSVVSTDGVAMRHRPRLFAPGGTQTDERGSMDGRDGTDGLDGPHGIHRHVNICTNWRVDVAGPMSASLECAAARTGSDQPTLLSVDFSLCIQVES
jgi:hypothetical protein